MSGENSLATRWLGRVAYADALALQQDLVARRREGSIPDTLLLLEHDPVYTIGRTRDQSSLASREALPYPVVETNRGGQATYHGPGQLIGYPILDLRFHGQDLHSYLRTLEQILIDTCTSYGIPTERRDGLTGVWCGAEKIASIGVGVRHWISMHGFAINVADDLAGFDTIVPCGIQNVRMTSVSAQRGREILVEEFAETLATIAAGHLRITKSGN
jgi:lipoyl(octanoyl) transferase